MDCVYHPGAAATGTCIACGQAACPACLEDVAGHLMCRPCVQARQSQVALESNPGVPTMAPPPPQASAPQTWASVTPGGAPSMGPPPPPAPAAPYNSAPAPQPVEIDGPPAQPIHYLKAFLYGSAAALIGAFIWDKFVMITGWQVGFIAVFLGIGVAIAVKVGAENRSGIGLSIMGAVLCAFCVLFGYVLIADEVAVKQSAELARLPWLLRLPIVAAVMVPHLSPMDWIFVAIAVWEGWSIPRQKTVVQPGIRDQLLTGIPERLEFAQAYPDQYPQLNREVFQQRTDELQALGFAWASDYRPANPPASWPPGLARLFVNAEQRCVAEVAQVFPANAAPVGPWCVVMSYLEDGWQLSTSNMPNADPAAYLMRRPRALWSRHPGATPEQLLHLHLQRREQLCTHLRVQPQPVSQAGYFEQQNRDNEARRATLAAMTDAQLLLDYREAQANPSMEWWGEYAPAKSG